MSKKNPQLKRIPEILWLITGILAFAVAVHKLITSGKDYIQYIVISILSLMMYLYRRQHRKNSL